VQHLYCTPPPVVCCNQYSATYDLLGSTIAPPDAEGNIIGEPMVQRVRTFFFTTDSFFYSGIVHILGGQHLYYKPPPVVCCNQYCVSAIPWCIRCALILSTIEPQPRAPALAKLCTRFPTACRMHLGLKLTLHPSQHPSIYFTVLCPPSLLRWKGFCSQGQASPLFMRQLSTATAPF